MRREDDRRMAEREQVTNHSRSRAALGQLGEEGAWSASSTVLVALLVKFRERVAIAAGI